MRVVRARGVNDAWPLALELISDEGDRRPSRNGDVISLRCPVATVYSAPTERVLMDPVRDANPMFHLHEALWMLAGRDDATWLDRFVRDFSARFAEDGDRMHGAYGRRWRRWFASRDGYIDQLDEVVRLLRANPHDRQAVISMWDPSADLGVPGLKDRPCNTQIFLRCDRNFTSNLGADGHMHATVQIERRYLDMTVLCRSNDIVYGCYGANVVHFSMLQEYLATRIGAEVGTYTQISNNWHMYESSRGAADVVSASAWVRERRPYPGTSRLVDDPETFDAEVRAYVDSPADFVRGRTLGRARNRFLVEVAWPLWEANEARLAGDLDEAQRAALRCHAPDWCQATFAWLGRRRKVAS